ncbi:NAD-dependent epimerase/dehydratase family protein [Pelotomaculum sp. PtaB.Bin117]|uniref:NAD-dependent epimerase/dehydratase family protein n=1 Tax=Pelotomaculum sp. PtaB.Bin117 TaxID=1811694 RepID=UPI0009C82E8C|nr:NAD-dependent epimerase/dehydratase family protein [Pelotomaculum sp. PtaB.Bin117]OPX92102.1 MAG: UDP-glucose 4-epimerase [Pelotomaculum sp. PtaB.Bin117]OPY62888.1 MAG: UDP-glucose 4-epimerase [Pelotomaculum sp. PtaU1.Bin065]
MRLKGRKVLVTGGAGFLGSHLCERLLAEGAEVRVLDVLASGRAANLSALLGQIDLINGDIASEDSVLKAVGNSDTVVHLAFPLALRERSIETPVITGILTGLLNLIQAALARDALLIYTSSIAVYGNGKYVPIDEKHPLEPVLIHGAVKLAGENFCRTLAGSNGLRTVILRAADIYGPRNTRISVPIKFLLQAMANEPITIYGDGSDSRSYTFVADFTEAVVLSMIRPEATGEVFNVGGDECVSMCELASEVKKIAGSSGPVLFQDSPAAGRRLFIDNRKSKEILGFKPSFRIGEGLTLTHRWLIDNPQYYHS